MSCCRTQSVLGQIITAISIDTSVYITLLESLSIDKSSLIISVGILPLYYSILGS
jgi:hypothetical protein